jgi:hypothetical protein
MIYRRFLPSGSVALLLGLALAGCAANSTSASGSVSPTPTCPSTTLAQFKQVVGTVTALNSSQMTVQTTSGPVTVNLSSRARVTEQQMAAQSDVQDGELIQVEVKDNTDGTYTAVVVLLTGRVAGSTGGGAGGGTGGGFGGGRGGRGTVTPEPAGCPTPSRGTGGGFGGGNGGTQGGLPTGSKLLTGTVVSILGQTLTIKATNGTVFTVTLDSTTVYSKIAAGKTSDLKINQAVRVIGQAQKNGSIDAQSITILLALPTSQ